MHKAYAMSWTKALPYVLPAAPVIAPVAGYYSALDDLPEDAHPHVKNVRHILGGGTSLIGAVPATITHLLAKETALGGAGMAIPSALLGFIAGRQIGQTANREQQNAVRAIRRNKGMLLGQEKNAGEVTNRLAAALYAGVPGAIGGAVGGAGMNLAGARGDESPESYAESAIRGALVGGILSALVGGAAPTLPMLGTQIGSAVGGAALGAVPGALRGMRE